MSDVRDPATDQPLPVGGDREVQQALIDAISARRDLGIRKYGQPVMTNNGRSALRDAWEEAIDLLVYLTQALLESGEDLPTHTQAMSRGGNGSSAAVVGPGEIQGGGGSASVIEHDSGDC